MPYFNLSRRSFLATSAALPWAFRGIASGLASSKSIPVGLELYSVRDALQNDPQGTVRAVAQMGYQVVEFYGPYFSWSEEQAKDMRKLMDGLGIRCLSTHNDEDNFSAAKIEHTKALNLILGTTYVVQAWSDPKPTLDGWKGLADRLNDAAGKLAPAGLKVGYHNHDAEWKPVEGKRPIEILAANTKPDVMLQLDVGTCLEAGADPVAWIRANPDAFTPSIVKTGLPTPTLGIRRCLGKERRIGKGSFRPPRALEESNTTSSSRKAAGMGN